MHDTDFENFDDAPPRAPRRRLGRRLTLAGLAAMVGGAAFAHIRPGWGSANTRDDESRADWSAFAATFISPDGRVVDTGNGGMTHTEGQGYGLLFAEHFDDRPTFDRLLAWTERTLRRSGDALHAWQFRPTAANPVPDRNNATDGDMMIAWALLRAGERWGDAGYTDLLRWCTRDVAGLKVLLPAAYGFESGGRVVVNPSYYVFPALAALARLTANPAWDQVRADGLRLLRAGCFGRWRLPADWLEVRGGSLETLAPAQGWASRFSWDAVRVPLNLTWAGLAGDPALDGVAGFWSGPARGATPAWVSLTDDTLAPYAASHGMTAVAQLLRAARGAGEDGGRLALPHVGEAEDYYSAALVLLSRVAWRESRAAYASS
jgi:endoglucanase